jgi:predicted transcriptional regulator
VTAITVQLEDDVADALRRLADVQQRSETDILRDALAAYVQITDHQCAGRDAKVTRREAVAADAQTARPLPKALGKYHSGQGNVSEQARDLLRQAVKDGLWP